MEVIPWPDRNPSSFSYIYLFLRLFEVGYRPYLKISIFLERLASDFYNIEDEQNLRVELVATIVEGIDFLIKIVIVLLMLNKFSEARAKHYLL